MNKRENEICERKWCTELGPPKGIEPGLRPVAIDGGDWTWKMMKEPASVESGVVGDRSLRFSNAQRRAFMLSSLPSTATITTPRFPDSDIVCLFDLCWGSCFFYAWCCSLYYLLAYIDFLCTCFLNVCTKVYFWRYFKI